MAQLNTITVLSGNFFIYYLCTEWFDDRDQLFLCDGVWIFNYESFQKNNISNVLTLFGIISYYDWARLSQWKTTLHM